MRRELVLTAIIFTVLGFLAGHVYTRQAIRTPVAPSSSSTLNPEEPAASGDAEAGLPPGHPPINTAEMVNSLKQAAEKNPGDKRAALELANALYDARRFDESVFWYRRVLALDPKDINARTDLGSAYYNLNRHDEAIAEFERSLQLDPTHPQTLYNLVVVKLNGKRDIAGAQEAFARLERAHPEFPMLADLKRSLAQARQARR